jgi:hypothetical protein
MEGEGGKGKGERDDMECVLVMGLGQIFTGFSLLLLDQLHEIAQDPPFPLSPFPFYPSRLKAIAGGWVCWLGLR